MERIFPFLFDDVLFIIHEYALKRTEKKELNNEIFDNYLKKHIFKLSLSKRSLDKLISIKFKNYNEFNNIVNYGYIDVINNSELLLENNCILYKTLPLGPRVKMYHCFVNNYMS